MRRMGGAPVPQATAPADAGEDRRRNQHGGKRVVLVSQHYLTSKRRAGFHHLADAYWRMGRDVVFVTAPVSWISWIHRDPRFVHPLIGEANAAKRIRERLTSYVLFTLVHPANLRLPVLNRMSAPVFERYRNAKLGALADLLE